jgi:hypothetical protein
MEIFPSGEAGVSLYGANLASSAGIVVDSSGEPTIALKDTQGFGMDMGSTNTVAPTTGETQQTPAASIVMFGRDKKHPVIWQAP